jgi:hypothetical protein
MISSKSLSAVGSSKRKKVPGLGFRGLGFQYTRAGFCWASLFFCENQQSWVILLYFWSFFNIFDASIWEFWKKTFATSMFSKACVCKEKVLYTHIKFTRNLSPKMKKTIQQQHLVPFGVQLKSFVQNLLGKRRQSKHKVTYCYTLNTIKWNISKQKATLVPLIHKGHKPKRIWARSIKVFILGGDKSRKEKVCEAKDFLWGAYILPFPMFIRLQQNFGLY